MLKPDPTRFPRAVHSRLNGPEWTEPEFEENEGEGREILEFRRPEELPADLALDLRLHEMLEAALVSTAATGAVIALASGDQMICRATAGEKSPKTGVYLNTHSGLSGLCIQTHEMQRCDDSLTDPRVNAAACRELEIRSIVVLPILAGEKLWGILEVFSATPSAFGDRDVDDLRVFCRRVARRVRKAVEGEPGMSASGQSFSSSSTPDELPSPESLASEIVRESTQLAKAERRRDYRTGALTAAVIALAVLLGWMVGRVGWSMAVNRSPTQLPAAAEEAQASDQLVPSAASAPPPDAASHDPEPADVVKPALTELAKPAPSKPAPKAKAQPAEPPGGLVVYENGKVVFRMDPSEKSPSSAASTPVQSAMIKEDDSSIAADNAPSRVEKSYLVVRVEPEYPEAAKQQNIQGPVVLNALVGTDGSVRDLKVVSGNPELVKAATDAVRQWKFRPHLLKSQPTEFETRITVNFQLP